jgi:hypothetical protein
VIGLGRLVKTPSGGVGAVVIKDHKTGQYGVVADVRRDEPVWYLPDELEPAVTT